MVGHQSSWKQRKKQQKQQQQQQQQQQQRRRRRGTWRRRAWQHSDVVLDDDVLGDDDGLGDDVLRTTCSTTRCLMELSSLLGRDAAGGDAIGGEADVWGKVDGGGNAGGEAAVQRRNSCCSGTGLWPGTDYRLWKGCCLGMVVCRVKHLGMPSPWMMGRERMQIPRISPLTSKLMNMRLSPSLLGDWDFPGSCCSIHVSLPSRA